MHAAEKGGPTSPDTIYCRAIAEQQCSVYSPQLLTTPLGRVVGADNEVVLDAAYVARQLPAAVEQRVVRAVCTV